MILIPNDIYQIPPSSNEDQLTNLNDLEGQTFALR